MKTVYLCRWSTFLQNLQIRKRYYFTSHLEWQELDGRPLLRIFENSNLSSLEPPEKQHASEKEEVEPSK